MKRNYEEEISEEEIQDRIFRDIQYWEIEEKLKKFLRRKHPRIKKVRKFRVKNDLPF